MANMIVVVYPAMAEANRNTAFEWYVGSDWDECEDSLMTHFDGAEWPYGSGDLVVTVENIDSLDCAYERETAQRIVDHYKTRGLTPDDVQDLCHVLYGLQQSWDEGDCAIALVAMKDGWNVGGLAGQADEDGWGESAASTSGRGFVEGVLEADGDSCPDWLLDNIEYDFVEDLDFAKKVSLAGETYYVYLNN